MSDKTREEFLKLVDKYVDGTATPEELTALDSYYALFADEPASTGQLTGIELLALEKRMEAGLFKRVNHPVRTLWPRIAAAASIIIVLSAGGYFLWHKPSVNQQTAHNNRTDFRPGTNGAILTLANGKKIILEQTKQGTITQQPGSALQKTGDSSLVYEQNNETGEATAAIAYNTLETPKGRQYQVVLPDGSKVWLNAGSTLKYPTQFKGNNRAVELTGEAYFEVIHNAARPFRVQTPNESVEDIGTSFNVNAYADEPVNKTTLLSGAIKVSSGKNVGITLTPGQQAMLSVNQQTIKIKQVTAEDAIAWKNGYFMFNNESLESAMRKISRWYNVEIEFKDEDIKSMNTYGTLSRFSNVSKVFDLFELSGSVKFKIEGNKIIVTKNNPK